MILLGKAFFLEEERTTLSDLRAIFGFDMVCFEISESKLSSHLAVPSSVGWDNTVFLVLENLSRFISSLELLPVSD